MFSNFYLIQVHVNTTILVLICIKTAIENVPSAGRFTSRLIHSERLAWNSLLSVPTILYESYAGIMNLTKHIVFIQE